MKSPGETVIPTPIRRRVAPAESEEAELQDDYPHDVIVFASTDLHVADEDLGDWIVCPLQSPGGYVARGGDLYPAFEAERATLSRVLGHLGVLNLAEKPSAESLRGRLRFPTEGEQIELGAVLAVLRIALGWSVEDLARASRLRSTTIADYEAGKLIPGLNSVSMVFEALGCPFGTLDVARTCIELLRSTRKHRV